MVEMQVHTLLTASQHLHNDLSCCSNYMWYEIDIVSCTKSYIKSRNTSKLQQCSTLWQNNSFQALLNTDRKYYPLEVSFWITAFFNATHLHD